MGSLQFPNMGMGLRLAAFGRQSSAIKIQAKTIDLSMRLWGITTEFVGFIPQSLVQGLLF